MTVASTSMKTPALWLGIFAAIHLAVLPMASTTALSNLTLAGLLLLLAWYFRREQLVWPPLIMIAWAVYIFAFPLISDASDVALKNLSGQWIKSLYAMLAGAGVAAAFARTGKGSALHLGMISMVILLIHLSLFGWKAWQTQSIPWKYWGIEVHHADLGYAAGQALILLAASMFAERSRNTWLHVLLGFLCFLSMFLAESRAGLVFGIFGVVFVFLTSLAKDWRGRGKHLFIGTGVFFGFSLLVLSTSLLLDARWQKVLPAFEIGFYGNALQLECEGLASVEDQVRSSYGSGTAGDAAMSSLENADAQRIVLARVGLELAASHPWGLDGSRQSFQKLLRQKCPDPAIKMSHTHNGWIDTLLAIGWLGAILYALVLVRFFMFGLAHLRSDKPLNEWALVLVALSAFWLMRGFTDSVFRDHMLQMQGFLLAYAAMAMRSKKQEPVEPVQGSNASDSTQSTPQASG